MRERNSKNIDADINPSRRQFLRLSLIGFAILNVSAVSRVWSNEVCDDVDAWLRILIRDNNGAAKLGADYLMQFGNEAEAKKLSHLIRRSLSKRYASPNNFIKFKSAIASLIRDEYRTGRTVQVDGWLLSQTEGRIYALKSLD